MIERVYRNKSVVAFLSTERLTKVQKTRRYGFVESAWLTQGFFGENYITIKCISRKKLALELGDWILGENNVKYYINQLPKIEKKASNNFSYTITFESVFYNLSKVQFLYDGRSDFNFVGKAGDYINLIISNLERVYGADIWIKGTCDQSNTDYRHLHFQEHSCRTALQKICTEFEAEVYFRSYNGNEINLTDTVGNSTGLSFEYRSGLRGISRKPVNTEENIVTRLYAYGSKKNIDTNYRSGERRLIFSDGGNRYLEKNTGTYGIIERSKIFDDIYPHRAGSLSSVNSCTVVEDSAIDFDVNDYLIPGVEAKLHFNSGNLAGYDFTLEEFNNSTKKFTLIPFEDQSGLSLPNTTLCPASGDEYVLTDISMPTSYVTAAENELQTTAQAYLDEHCTPHVSYQIEPDKRYFRRNNIRLNIGDEITIVDSDLGIDAALRITKLEKSLIDKYEYKIEISNYAEPSIAQSNQNTTSDLQDSNNISNPGSEDSQINSNRKNWLSATDLKDIIIAPDGYIRIGLVTADNIITGVIRSNDDSTYFDLDNNQLVIGAGGATGIENFTDAGIIVTANSLDDIPDGVATVRTTYAQATGATRAFNAIDSSGAVTTRLLPGDNIGTPPGNGIFVGGDKAGFYYDSEWMIYFNNSGHYLFKGNDDNYISWDGSNHYIRADQIELGTATAGIGITGDRLVYYDSGTFFCYLSNDYPGQTTKATMRLANANGGQFVAGSGSVASYSSQYSVMDDGHISIVNTSADSAALLSAYRNSNDTTAIMVSRYGGTGTATLWQGLSGSSVVAEVHSDGTALFLNMQLLDTNPEIIAHSGSAYQTMVLDAASFKFQISDVDKIIIDSSGNIDSSGYIDGNGFKNNGTAGISNTSSGTIVDLHSSGGIVTSITRVTPASNGETSNVRSVTIDNGIVTAISAYSGASVTEFSTDTTMAGDSDTAVPTEKAVKAYVDNKFSSGSSGSFQELNLRQRTDTKLVEYQSRTWTVTNGLITGISAWGSWYTVTPYYP